MRLSAHPLLAYYRGKQAVHLLHPNVSSSAPASCRSLELPLSHLAHTVRHALGNVSKPGLDLPPPVYLSYSPLGHQVVGHHHHE